MDDELARNTSLVLSGSTQSPADKERERRIQKALETAKARSHTSQDQEVQAWYGHHIKRDGKSQKSYEDADRVVAGRLALSGKGRDAARDHILKHSPSVTHLSGQEQQRYVTATVNQVYRDPHVYVARSQTKDVMAVSGQSPTQGTPASTALSAKPDQAKVSDLSDDDGAKIYKSLVAKVKKEAISQKDADRLIAMKLQQKGFNDQAVAKVIKNSPEVKSVATQEGKEAYLQSVMYRVEQRAQTEQRLDLEKQHIQQIQHSRGKGMDR